MAKLFNLSIIAPENILYEGKASSLVAPSELGYFGILADHIPFIASLINGKITLKDDSDRMQIFESHKGFIEVLKNNVTILLNQTK